MVNSCTPPFLSNFSMKMKLRRQTSLLSCIRVMIFEMKESISFGLGILSSSPYGCFISCVEYEKNGIMFTKPDVGTSTSHYFIPKLSSLKSIEFSLNTLWWMCYLPVLLCSQAKIACIKSVIRIWMRRLTLSIMTLRVILYSAWLNLNLRFSFYTLSMTRRVSSNFFRKSFSSS